MILGKIHLENINVSTDAWAFPETGIFTIRSRV